MTVGLALMVVAASIAVTVGLFWRAGRGEDWLARAMAAALCGVPLGALASLLPLVVVAALLGPISR